MAEIEANNAEEAKQKTEELYSNGDIVLTADDYIDGSTDFKVEVL
ncbi:MAG: DpnD/PcfM family protein [Eubacterium sp.]|nr:DpnD/PcfM family protein [Eubacterium sp.]